MSAKLRKRFGENVRELRKAMAKPMSQEEFADYSGFTRSYMSRIERGLANVSIDTIEVLAESLKVEISTLFNQIETTQRVPTADRIAASQQPVRHKLK